jgi:hypothetical protein
VDAPPRATQISGRKIHARHALASILSMLMSTLGCYSLLLTSADLEKKKSFYFPFYAFYFICNIQKKKNQISNFKIRKFKKKKKRKRERKLALTNNNKKKIQILNFKIQKKCGIYFFYSIFMSRDQAKPSSH